MGMNQGQRRGQVTGTQRATAGWSRRATLVGRIGLLVVAWAGQSFAAGGRTDYDLDNDSLIEIDDLDDLNEIRNAPFGTALYGSSAGCPATGCHGFELTTDLDFDTNDDGVVNPADDHYTGDGVSSGGWVPIPLLATTFDGNNHVIRNFTLLGDFGVPEGLFADLVGAGILNLHFEDVNLQEIPYFTGVVAGQARVGSGLRNVSVVGGTIYSPGNSGIGGLIGLCQSGSVEESRTSIDLRASGQVGGLIGWSEHCTITRSFVLGRTASSRYHGYIGGLVGYMDFGSITDSFVSGSTGAGYWFGGLIGETVGAPTVTNSFVSGAIIGNGGGGGGVLGVGNATFVSTFYATDTGGFTKTEGDGAVAVTLADLKCTDAPSDPDCLPGLFAGWQSSTNSDGAPAWDFGTNQQVPALRIEGIVYRDSDGDGLLDADDEFPFNWEASLDTDNDGAIDFWHEGCGETCRAASSFVLDQFPENVAAALDLDLDGRPDAWNSGCNAACQTSSQLTLDTSPGDRDNDGLGDLVDQDDDNNGVADVDLDSDNLIDVSTFARLLQVDMDPTGASLRTDMIGSEGSVVDTSGCRPRVVRGTLRRECDGYELLADLDFDTNGDDVIDENDTYWNGGNGWQPLGHLGDDRFAAFQTNFEGNGHTVANIFVSRGNEAGFFGGTRGANIRNLGLTGSLMSIQGTGRAGGLVGDMVSTTITNCYSTGPVVVSGGITAGGLVGSFQNSAIIGSFATGDVLAVQAGFVDVGGLVGSMIFDGTLSASFASGSVSNDGGGSAGGLVGFANEWITVSGSYSIGPVDSLTADEGGLIGSSFENVVSSYWATDTSLQSSSAGNAQGAGVLQLACPVAADNTNACVPGVTLYAGWEQYQDENELPYWEFGATSELPGLCLDGRLYRVNTSGALLPVTECACSVVAEGLVTNQAFESNTTGWTASYGASIATSTTQKHGGARSLRVSNRNTASWQGANYSLLGVAVPGETLAANLWARVEGDPSEPVYFTLRSTCQGASTVYTRVAEATATNTGWVELDGTVTIPSCTLTELVVYAEGPRTGVVLYIDDVSVTRTAIACDGTEGPLGGTFVVTTSWNGGYCGELRVTNPSTQPTIDWTASLNLNGSTIYDIWNLDTTANSGNVTMTPNEPFAHVIPPGGASHSLGFCANRPSGSSALPTSIVVTGMF